MHLLINNKEIIFNVEYGQTKKIKLFSTPHGHLLLKVPTHTTNEEIEAFMKQNTASLMAFIEKKETQKVIKSKKSYDEEALFLFLGKACTLNELIDPLPETEEAMQLALKKFYTKQTKKIIKKRVAHYEPILKVKAKKITIVDSAASWGTCNSYAELTFNYKLSMAPLPVIDYVVIHELCHILHLNHDRSFWRKVGAFDRSFKAHEQYLSRFSSVMTI